MCFLAAGITYLFYRCLLLDRDFEVNLNSRLQGECCICLDEMDVRDSKNRVVAQECLHLMHYRCLKQLRAFHNKTYHSCPLCRKKIGLVDISSNFKLKKHVV